MNVVLVGGSGDGTRVVLPDDKTRYALVVFPPISWDAVNDREPIAHKIEYYNLFRLHPVTRAVIFAYEELTPTQIMERLLEHYAPLKVGL